MKHIVVAGAGHGGLSCAYMLAKSGYSVTVIEAKKESELGWDWHDMMHLGVFDEIGMPSLPMEQTEPAIPMTYISPDKKTKIQVPATTCQQLVYIDRKQLLAHLIAECKKAGVTFLFDTRVMSASTENDCVVGVLTEHNGEKSFMEAHLTVDAAGVDSSVRKSLPAKLGIQNNIPDEDVFYVYRGYYQRISQGEVEHPDCVYLMHNNQPGMDWVITGKDFVDFLIGHFGKTAKQSVQAAISDFLLEYAKHTNGKLIRGGSFAKIPLTKTLGLFVANGYAAVGDSACMTEPMSGSGISLSMKAGSILAQTVMAADSKALTVDVLWGYQYRYLKECGFRYMGDYRMKRMLANISPNDINGFLGKNIIGEYELKHNGLGATTKKEIVKKLFKALPYAHCLPHMVPFVTGGKKTQQVKNALPKVYDKACVEAWVASYSKL